MLSTACVCTSNDRLFEVIYSMSVHVDADFVIVISMVIYLLS